MSSPLHLVSDLDGTWIPRDGDTAGLRALESYVSRLPGVSVTFATGRTIQSVITGLSSVIRFWPSHIVTDVGTAIFVRSPRDEWVEDDAYAATMSDRWDAAAAESVCSSLPPGIRAQPGVHPLRRLALEPCPGVDPREAFGVLADYLDRVGMVADVLASNERCLDVLPKGVNKGTAVSYLAAHVRPSSRLVVCGDSENDLGMFRLADVGIIMADSPLTEFRMRPSGPHVIRPRSKGPAGILEVLVSLQGRG
jgi:hydroxymethylpyrimidine pyrophosphatase-like HAD family hydrolase